MGDETGAVILRPGEGRSIDLGNFTMSLKAGSEETAGAFAPRGDRAR